MPAPRCAEGHSGRPASGCASAAPATPAKSAAGPSAIASDADIITPTMAPARLRTLKSAGHLSDSRGRRCAVRRRPGHPCASTDTKLVSMRRFLSVRWLGLHAAMVAIVAGFLALGWWQLRRAQGGNALSWGYTFEWPLFAGFVVVFWLRTMQDEWRETHAAEGEGPPAAAEVTLPAGIRSASSAGDGADGDDEDAELADYNAYLARLNAEASRPGG